MSSHVSPRALTPPLVLLHGESEEKRRLVSAGEEIHRYQLLHRGGRDAATPPHQRGCWAERVSLTSQCLTTGAAQGVLLVTKTRQRVAQAPSLAVEGECFSSLVAPSTEQTLPTA